MAVSFFSKSFNQDKSSVLIISADVNRLEYIKQVLTLKGVKDFVLVNKSPLEIVSSEFEKNFWAAVVDGVDITDEAPYIDIIKKNLPKQIACVVLGNNDSIKLHQKFMQQGITYLNYETQINDIYQKLITFDNEIFSNSAIKISILGSKGGIGTSYVSFHLAKLIRQRYLTPAMLVQGVGSSFNIDILANKNFDKEYFDADGLNFYKEYNDDAYLFDNPKFKNFNFVIFDHSVQSLEKEMIEHILNNSDSVVIVTDTNVASIRKTKEILKINHFLKSVKQGVSKTIVCMNNHTKQKYGSLMISDINKLLEDKIEHSIPFSNISNELGSRLTSRSKSAFDELADALTGVKTSAKFSLFRSLR